MDTDDITDGMPAHINQATQTGIAKMNADEARALARSKHEATYTDQLVEYHLKRIKLAADAGLFETSFMRGLRGVYSQADRNATARRLREMGYAVENDTISWHELTSPQRTLEYEMTDELKSISYVLDQCHVPNTAFGGEGDAEVEMSTQDRIRCLHRMMNEQKHRAESAERHAESLDKLLCNLEDAATAITPYPEGYRPNAYEAAIQLPDALRKTMARVRELEEVIRINNICHDLHGKVGPREFATGCANEQRKLFGCAPVSLEKIMAKTKMHTLDLPRSVWVALPNHEYEGYGSPIIAATSMEEAEKVAKQQEVLTGDDVVVTQVSLITKAEQWSEWPETKALRRKTAMDKIRKILNADEIEVLGLS